MLDNTLTIILAGGVGSRLAPLTEHRAKPAVPFGGKYRIIDFTLANCLHSGLRRVLVLTQYKSHSLQKHLRDGWSIFNPELGEYITPVPPQMRVGERWYSGTADAIYHNLYLLERSEAKYVLVLSGDHIYRMDYAAMLEAHSANKAAVTVACMQVPIDEARSFGVMRVDAEHRIVDFQEKPAQPAALPDDPQQALASMGIYVFSMELLLNTLRADHAHSASEHDFGKDILPRLIGEQRVFAYMFGGKTGRVTPDRYWRDVGTLDALRQSHLDFVGQQPARLPRMSTLSEWYLGRGSVAMPGALVPGSARLTGCLVAPGTQVPSGLVAGEDPDEDSRWFRRDKNTLLITQAMLDRRAAMRVPMTLPAGARHALRPQDVA